MSNSNIFMPSGFLRVPLQNGVGRYVCQLQRIVFKFCKNHGASRGVRDFIENDLINFARNQPGVVVYVKPRRHRSPVVIGEFLNGDRQWLSLHNKTQEEVAGWVNVLLGSNDASGLRYRKHWSTDNPSIQGPWMPTQNLINRDRLDNSYVTPAVAKLKELAKQQGIIKEE